MSRQFFRTCREIAPAKNEYNKPPHGKKSRFKGVYPRGEKWYAVFKHKGKTYYLGTFDDEVEAAKARDRKAYELEGEFAYLNFPEEILGKGGRGARADGAQRAAGRGSDAGIVAEATEHAGPRLYVAGNRGAEPTQRLPPISGVPARIDARSPAVHYSHGSRPVLVRRQDFMVSLHR